MPWLCGSCSASEIAYLFMGNVSALVEQAVIFAAVFIDHALAHVTSMLDDNHHTVAAYVAVLLQ